MSAPHIEIKLDMEQAVKDLRSQFSGLTDNEFNRRIAATMNEMARKARTESNRQARSVYPGVTLKTLRGAQKDTKAGATKMEVEFVTKGRPIPIAKLQARQTKQGITYNLKGSRVLVKRAWLTKHTVNDTGESYRLGWARGKYIRPRDKGFLFMKGGRKPIDTLKTVSVPGALLQKSVDKAFMEVLENKFVDRAAHVLANAVARKGK